MTTQYGRGIRILAAGVALMAAAWAPGSGPAPIPAGLFTDGLSLVGQGQHDVVPVAPHSGQRFIDGSRVLADASSTAATARADDQRWLTAGIVPGGPELASMNTQALLDLRSLTAANGAVVAGWTPRWRYVWPRDASFVAAAYSATGHRDDALRVLTYLASIAPTDGRWQARYLPDGTGAVPDTRGIQLDGAGWVLWAADRYAADAAAAGETSRTKAALAALWPMLVASADGITASLGADGLPPVSPDYWERNERALTLGTAAPDLAGLQAAGRLATLLGRTDDAARWSAAAKRLQDGMGRHFGSDGWHRTRGGEFDAAVTFTMAPFIEPSLGDTALLDRAFAATRNPNGGVRPGANWHRNGVSWTPEMALFGLAYASNGEQAKAREVLTWLAAHRTGLGSLPEKVNPGGEPAAVAPLAWTCALVLLTSVELD